MHIRVLTATVLAIPLLVFPAGTQGFIQAVDTEASKKPKGGYQDDLQSATINPGKSKLFFWRVHRMDGDATGKDFIFREAGTSSGEAGYKIRWYKGKKPKARKNITSDVRDSGYEFQLGAGKRKAFTAKVKAKPGGELCLGGEGGSTSPPYYDGAYFEVNSDNECD